MQVVISKSQLEGVKACTVYLDSPEWDEDQGALVYNDWNATVERLLSSRAGTTFLAFLVQKELVPMTRAEFKSERAKRGSVQKVF